jgi:hypothetical protein
LRKRAQRPRRTTSWSSATRIRKGTDHLPNQVASKNRACFGCTIKINGLPYSSDRNWEFDALLYRTNALFQHRNYRFQMYLSDNTRDTRSDFWRPSLGLLSPTTMGGYRDLLKPECARCAPYQSLLVGDLGCGLTAIT